jgi:cyclic pyranopterin phosphate synthase
MPEEGIPFQSHREILTYEELLRIVELAVKKGIRKVRVTGGEPFVRKGVVDFIKQLYEINQLKEISITTNGVLLSEYAEQIKKNGIARINISLDSLKPERFREITGRDYYNRVWEGIEKADQLGFSPIKINVVAMRGVNDDEILDFARLTIDRPFHIRFIEFMPIGEQNGWSADKFLSVEEIHNKISSLGQLVPITSGSMDGPASRFRLDDGKGEIGFIGAFSHQFCDRCNRLRLTANGHLRSCLFSDEEIDIKTPIREGKDDAHILDLMQKAILTKPQGHCLSKLEPRKCVRSMSSIGG